MGLENGRWRVQRGDCLWRIAASVYGNGNRWREIASANGLATWGNPIIYPGQLFVIPGVTPGTGGAPAPAPAPTPAWRYAPNIVWWSLQAGSEREMEVIWQHDDNNHNVQYRVRWEIWDSNGHLWQEGSDEMMSFQDQQKAASHTFATTEGRNVCRISIRGCDKDGNNVTDWAWKEYDFRNNPPQLPPTPSITMGANNEITIEISNIDKDNTADSIEIAIYQDNTTKYSTAKVPINTETRYAKYVLTVPDGHTYTARCRAVRGTIYGGWTEFTSSVQSLPIAPTEITTLTPKVLSEQSSKKYGALVEWTPVEGADNYIVQYTTQLELFQNETSGNISSATTEKGKGANILISDLEAGHRYYFRVCSVNSQGNSRDYTPIRDLTIGEPPSAPTTYSNTTSAIAGEDLNLYWVHNSKDGSLESYAQVYLKITDPLYPDKQPTEITKNIQNTKSEENQNEASVLTINSNNTEFAALKAGFVLTWKVRTAGVTGVFGNWSVERTVSMYTKPELEIDMLNNEGTSIDEVNGFPFSFSILAKPSTQVPISYYIEVISNNSYNTIDDVGNVKYVNAGDKIYEKYYDPDSTNAWKFLLELTPYLVDLQTGSSYTMNCTVAMNSGLTATSSKTFTVNIVDVYYQVYGDIVINDETLVASIHPYCYEYADSTDDSKLTLTDNCTLSVYRREYDGSFTEIAKDVNNEEDLYVTDPHPSLDYARYRIVARTKDTGAISYKDIEPVKIKESAVVIQWAEKWSSFKSTETNDDTVEPAYSGSMLKLPYNIDVSDNKTVDVSLVNYAGREHPVSYYGTSVDEKGTWNVDIPADDKDTLYGIRRLAKWKDNVYVREPSGIGYWASLNLSYNISHNNTVIPITFNITRVEGGM